jgi:hypothetical protein
MSLVRIPTNPSRGQLMVFGLLWLAAFILLGLGAWHHGHPWAAAGLWGAAAVVPGLGCIWRSLLRAVYLAAAWAVLPLGLAVSLLVLLAVYYLLVTPLGLALRCFGYDPLRRRFDRQAGSYWLQRGPADSARRHFRQF